LFRQDKMRLDFPKFFERSEKKLKPKADFPKFFERSEKKLNEKGQMVFMDFFLVATIFIVLFIFIASDYSQKTTDLLNDAKLERMKLKAITASDFLASSKGYPAAWEKDLNVMVLGLASEPNELDSNKVMQFISMNYGKARDALGLSEFNYFFQLNDAGDKNIVSSGTIPLGETSVVSVERIVIYKGGMAKIVLKAWG